MEATNYLEVLRRRWPIVLLAVVIAAGTVFLSTPAKPPPIEKVWNAEHLLIVGGVDEFGFAQQGATISPSQIPTLILRGEVPERVAAALGEDPDQADSLARQMQATYDQEGKTILITTRQPTGDRAIELVNEFAKQTIGFLTEVQDTSRQNRLDTARIRLDRIAEEIDKLDTELSKSPDDELVVAKRDASVRLYGFAYESLQQLELSVATPLVLTTNDAAERANEEITGGFSAPRTRLGRLPLAAGIGLAGGLLLAFAVERFDNRIRDRRRAERSFDAPVIGEIPTLSRSERGTALLVDPGKHGRVAELFRTLRSSVVFLASDGQNRPSGPVGVILVTSAAPAEGKSTTTANLAAAFAESGRSVVVVNADFRRPRISDYFLDHKPVTKVLLSELATIHPLDLLIATKVPGIRLLDLSGVPATAGELARATRRLVTDLASSIDVILIDSPPLLVTAEALEFVPQADAVLFSARLGKTSADGATRAAELIRFGGVERVAVVLQEADVARQRRGRYYGYYKGYEGPAGADRDHKSLRRPRKSSSPMPAPEGPQRAPNRQNLHSKRLSDIDPGLAATTAQSADNAGRRAEDRAATAMALRTEPATALDAQVVDRTADGDTPLSTGSDATTAYDDPVLSVEPEATPLS